jgi:hypothetical protein
MTDMVTIEDIDSIPPENTIVVPSRAEERELREGLRARGFPDNAIDEYVTVDEARRIIRNAAPECAQDYPIIMPPEVEGESFCWFGRLPDEHKDAALDHGLKYIAARNSKLLDPQNSDNLIPEIARSGAPHAANIFVRHTQKGNGADRQDAIRNCIARRPKAPIGRLIVAAYKYGANFEPWWRLGLDAPPEQRKGDTSEVRIAANAPEPKLARGRESAGEAPIPTGTPWEESFVPEPHDIPPEQAQEIGNGSGQPPPEPNRSQIETLVRTLFKHATAGNWASLRAFIEGRTDLPPFRIVPLKLDGNLDVLIDWAYQVAQLAAHVHEKVVFCPPVATFTNSKHAREVDLAEGLVLNAECDAHPQEARTKLEAVLGPATMVVESGGEWTNPETGENEPKLHIYHRLKVPARSKDEQKKLKLARKLAAKIAGGDPSNVPLVHPIRWPGSVHRKGEPKLCRIISLNPDAEIDLDTALELLQKAIEPPAHPEPNQDLQFPPLPFAPIKEGCPWLRRVHVTGGSDQSEVLWRDALRVGMFLKDGKTLIHEFSNQHAGYNFADTEAKYDLAYKAKEENDLGWPQCRTIHEHGSTHCKTCPHLAAEGSPLHLALQWGRERRAKQIAENIKIGDDVTEPLLPQVMTLEEMLIRLVFIGSTGAVADRRTGRIRAKHYALDEYMASKYTPITGKNAGKEGPALKFWIACKERVTVEVLAWVPGSPEICQPPEGPGPAFNMWRGLPPMAYPEDWQKRVEPFLEHIDYLVPAAGERERFLQWLAHTIQEPQVLPHTSYLMITPTRGIGRNLLASILVRALRGFVAAGISLPDILDGGFTGRLSKKLLAIVDEAREGSGERRYQRANRLSQIITEEHRHINPKYGHQSVEKNCCRWLKFSNFEDAIPFDEADRRVNVIFNPTGRKGDTYYERLYGLLNDHAFIGSVRHWLETKDIAAFRPGEHAPMNEAKLRVLNAMMSEIERAVAEFKEDCKTELTARSSIKNYVFRNAHQVPVHDTHLTHAIRRAGMVNTGRRIMGFEDSVGAEQEHRITVVIVRGEWTVEAVKKASSEKLLAAMGLRHLSATKQR